MAKLDRAPGSTGNILLLFVQDPTGAPLPGLGYDTPGLRAAYKRDSAGAAVAVGLAPLRTLGAWTPGGFREVDPVLMPGLYEFHAPDEAFLGGARTVVFRLGGPAGMAPCLAEVDLDSGLL